MLSTNDTSKSISSSSAKYSACPKNRFFSAPDAKKMLQQRLYNSARLKKIFSVRHMRYRKRHI
jgi:hypothetical protein